MVKNYAIFAESLEKMEAEILAFVHDSHVFFTQSRKNLIPWIFSVV